MWSKIDFSRAAAGPLALYGGTFDPVHNGHIYAAHQVRKALQLDKVVFLPAGQPPHKVGQVTASAAQRWHMLQLALEDEQGLYLSDFEIGRKTRCYTADTLTQLRQLCPHTTDLVFIVGADSLMEMHTWYKPEVILQIVRLAVVTRPDVDHTALQAQCKHLREAMGARIDLVLCSGMDISSTHIREAAALGLPTDEWLPPKVAVYIREQNMYREVEHEP